ncbi:MAG: hypothetical protein IJ532_02135 [Alphaproteobacteria bacterium]|nr:hypothetical protein [Alphaproteobacteria bacterium]
MNELNSTKDNKVVISPLSHDYEGRFSRKGDKDHKIIYNPEWLDTLLSILFISFLLMTDFMLFASSGNVKTFEFSAFPTGEVMIIMSGIILYSAITILSCYKYRKLKHAVVAFYSLFFVYMIFKQFSQYYHYVNIGSHIVPIYIVIGVVFAVVSFFVFEQNRQIYRILYVVAAGVLFLHIYISYTNSTETHEYIEAFNIQKPSDTKNKKFVYLMLPDFVSYSYISTFHSPEAEETRHLIRGFWQKNNFKVYNRAYTPEKSYLYNMAAALNPAAKSETQKHILKNRLLTEYWRFYNLRNEFIYLKDTELYDIFRKNKFQISAYKSRDFDMCRKNYFFNVSRCVEKVNRPTNLYDMDNISLWAKTGILMIDWISSIDLFNNVLPSLYKLLEPVANVDKMPMVGTNYNNLYVVNSVKTFDILLEDIKKDEGKQAYFVFADIPSDMYIYDEYCHIRPQTQWLNKSNLPWIKRDYTYQRRDAYLQQTRCLIGKMEYFIDELKKANIWDNTVLMVQGTSGLNNFQNEPIDDVSEDFIANRLVEMAVHDSGMTKYENDDKLCSTTDFVAEYLYGFKRCNPANLGLHTNVVNEINRKISYLLRDINNDYSDKFDKWYEGWKTANGQDTKEDDSLITSREDNDNKMIPEDEANKDLNAEFEKLELNDIFAE